MKENVIAVLSEEREKYSGEDAGKLDKGSWEEYVFDRLMPYLRIEFPKERVEALLAELKTADNFDQALNQVLSELKQIWEGERRTGKDRRNDLVQRIELESGRFIWHDVDQTRCGFERRTGKDRRDTT